MRMTEGEGALVRGARYVANRVGVQRREQLPWLPTPRLRKSLEPTGEPPTAWMITPHWDQPSGGIRKLYRAVDVLNEAGIAAAVVHDKPEFSCDWFEHSTRVVAAKDLIVSERD